MNYENLYFCVLFYKAIKYLSEGGHTKYQCKNKHRKNLSSSFSQILGIHMPSIYGEKKRKKPHQKQIKKTHLDPLHQPLLFQFAITEILWQILK